LHNIPEERRSHERYLTNRDSPLSMQAKCGWAFCSFRNKNCVICL